MVVVGRNWEPMKRNPACHGLPRSMPPQEFGPPFGLPVNGPLLPVGCTREPKRRNAAHLTNLGSFWPTKKSVLGLEWSRRAISRAEKWWLSDYFGPPNGLLRKWVVWAVFSVTGRVGAQLFSHPRPSGSPSIHGNRSPESPSSPAPASVRHSVIILLATRPRQELLGM